MECTRWEGVSGDERRRTKRDGPAVPQLPTRTFACACAAASVPRILANDVLHETLAAGRSHGDPAEPSQAQRLPVSHGPQHRRRPPSGRCAAAPGTGSKSCCNWATKPSTRRGWSAGKRKCRPCSAPCTNCPHDVGGSSSPRGWKSAAPGNLPAFRHFHAHGREEIKAALGFCAAKLEEKVFQRFGRGAGKPSGE